MPSDAELPTPPPEPKHTRFFRDDEIEELFTVMRHPDWKGSVSEAADVAGIDRRRAKLILKREIAEVVTSDRIKGNVSATAQELGLPIMTVWHIMQSDGFLKGVNTATDPAQKMPTDLDTINRDVLSAAEMEEMKAVMNQDRDLSSFKWEKLGLKPSNQKHLIDLESFAKGSLNSSLNLTHGGLIYCFAEVIGLFKDTKKLFDDNQLPIEETEFGPKDSKKEYAYLMLAMTAEIRNINAQVQRGTILKLKQAELELQKRIAERGGGSRPSGKGKHGTPGFSSGPPPTTLIQVNAAAGTSVKVSDERAE